MIQFGRILFCLACFCLIALYPSSVFADLPPRPIPPSEPQSEPQSHPAEVDQIEGAKIVLILPAEDHPTINQTSWTTVQWQDKHGKWHDVAGWQGTPTFNPEAHQWEVEWWVGEENLSAGPFRWVIEGQKSQFRGKQFTPSFQLPSTNLAIKEISP